MFKEYKSVTEVVGPLMVVEGVEGVKYEELVDIILQDGTRRRGRVLEIDRDKAMVQIFEGSSGINLKDTSVRFLGKPLELAVSEDMIGRIFDGTGKPIDDGPALIPEKHLDINGYPINPVARDYPSEFIQTGISTIDGLNTLVRGQKLPIFSGSGLSHNNVAAQIARQARVLGSDETFAVVFAAMGITFEEANFSTIYERAGRLRNKKGSITQIPILTMPEDDLTHPIPDLTGYITEGQIILSRELYKQGIEPPVNAIPSLSRLKDKGIGVGKTREDHADTMNQLYAAYTAGREARELAVILGEAALSDADKAFAKFAEEFDKRYVNQGYYTNRSIEETLNLGWELLSIIPRAELKRIRDSFIEKYLPGAKTNKEGEA